jgi:hypothetical protein
MIFMSLLDHDFFLSVLAVVVFVIIIIIIIPYDMAPIT